MNVNAQSCQALIARRTKRHIIQTIPGTVDHSQTPRSHELGVLLADAASAGGAQDDTGERLTQAQLAHKALAREARAAAALLVTLAQVPHGECERKWRRLGIIRILLVPGWAVIVRFCEVAAPGCDAVMAT
jgi:hypothetical protein